MGGGVEAGKAFVKYLLDDSELKSGLDSTGKTFKKFGTIGASVSMPIVAGFGSCLAIATKLGSELADMSARTGISANKLSQLAFVADGSGTSMAAVEKAVKKMQVALGNSANDGGKFASTLSRIGLNINEIKSLTPDQQFTKIAAAIAGIEDPAQRAAMAAKIFGKAGSELMPMLAEGSAAFEKAQQRAEELGASLSNEEVQALDAFGDALTDSKNQLMGLAGHIGAALAGPLTSLLLWSQDILADVNKFIQDNPTLASTFGGIAAAVLGLSGGMYALGTAMTLYSTFAKGAAFATKAFGFVLAIVSAHPVIAALTLIAALVAGVAYYFGWASKEADGFSDKMNKIKIPGGGSAQSDALKLQSAQTMAQLQNAPLEPTAVASPQMSASVGRQASEVSGDAVAWLRQIADNTKQMLFEIRNSDGMLVGAG